jgi:fibronectin type 3 domain-containing protein
VNLTWSDSYTTLSGFSVYCGTTTGGPYAKINSSLIPSTSYPDSGVQSGSTYYYVTTTADTTGAESSYSNESADAIP